MAEININPEAWVNVLREAVESRTAKAQEHKYITFDGKKYEALTQSQLATTDQKIPLAEIVAKSSEQFEALKQSFSTGEIKQKEYDKLVDELSFYTNRLIVGRVSKRNQVGKLFLRGISYAVAVVSSLIFGIGIPLWRKLRKLDGDFKTEIALFKNHVLQGVMLAKGVEDQLSRIPSILKDLDNSVTDDDRLALLQKRMEEDYPKGEELKKPNVHQFEKDINRGVAFFRKDKAQGIDDKAPQPSYTLKGKQRIQSGAALIDDLLKKTERDKQWKFPLQLVTNQTSLNAVFDAVVLMFNVDAVGNGVMWEDPDTGKPYALKAAFSDKLPPIGLEIIRDPRSNEIKEVKVAVTGYLDIISFNTGKGSDTNMIAPQAIMGSVNYTLTLDNDGRPVISDLYSNIEANRKKPLPEATDQGG